MDKSNHDGRYFTIAELCKSNVARARGIANVPPLEAEQNLGDLIHIVLDPLREEWKRPIIVSSGYRSPELNAAVGGVKNSYHMRGMAADIYDRDGETRLLFECLERLYWHRRVALTECYYDREDDFIHVAYDWENAPLYPMWEQ